MKLELIKMYLTNPILQTQGRSARRCHSVKQRAMTALTTFQYWPWQNKLRWQVRAGPVNKDRTESVPAHRSTEPSALHEGNEKGAINYGIHFQSPDLLTRSVQWTFMHCCDSMMPLRKKSTANHLSYSIGISEKIFLIKHLYSKNVLLAINTRYVKINEVKRKDIGKQCAQYWSSLCWFLKKI